MAVTAAVLLGAVFLLSGALKLRDRSWPAAAKALGTPAPLVPLVAPAELILGALLIVGPARRPFALAGAGLLVVFTGVVIRAIASGDRPVCACFGSFSARPIGPGSVVRNLVLILVALIAAL